MNRDQLRILYLCADSGIPYHGIKGGSIHMREIVSCLAEINCDITVVARDADAEPSERVSYRTCSLPDIADNRILLILDALLEDDMIKNEFEDLFRNPEIENLLEDIYTENKFDVVYERYSLFNVAGLRFCKKYDIPHVLEVNAPLVDEAAKYRHLSLSDIAPAVEKTLFANSDHIIAVSSELKEYILRKSPRAQVTVVPNGVRIDHFSLPTEKDPVSSGNEKFTIGFLGSLKPWHGVEILLDSFARISEDNDDYHLLIIGDNRKKEGDLERRCKDLGIEKKVTFTGAVDYDDVPGILQRTDLLVAPYPPIDDFYFSSLKVFEYMAAGKAIVASNIGQISGILTHEKTALLVPPGNITLLGNAFVKLKNDPELRKRLGERARMEARRSHTWSQRADKILAVIKSLI